MSNLLIAPMILPIMTAVILVFLRGNVRVQRLMTLVTLIVVLIISLFLLMEVEAYGIMRLDFSGWLPPYGILFVGDALALLLVTVAIVVTIACCIYAFSTISEAYENMFFYSFVLMLVAGVNGSFLTGDIFNLFVCFEVMLLASYVLVALGGGKRQLRESLKYVLINVVASWMFLVALAYLYGAVGTLNMAHIATRVAEVGQDPVLTTISLVFLIVFSLKAGLLLFFWLPGSYSVPPTSVAALFAALLTKVGMYALIRTFTLMFPHDQDVTHTIIAVMAVLTLIAGMAGAMGGRDVKTIATYNVLIGVGFIMLGLAIANEQAFMGVVYYLMHDMVAKAMLFLCIGMMIYLTGETVVKNMSGLIRNYPVFGWLYFVALCALVGIPPLSGFVGKILIGQGAIAGGDYVLLAVGFISSIAVLYSLLRIFLASFFGETIIVLEDEVPIRKGMMGSLMILTVCIIFLGLGANYMMPFVEAAAAVLVDPSIYIDAVLQGNE